MYYAVGLNFGSDPRTFSTENKTKVTKGDLDSSDSLARLYRGNARDCPMLCTPCLVNEAFKMSSRQLK